MKKKVPFEEMFRSYFKNLPDVPGHPDETTFHAYCNGTLANDPDRTRRFKEHVAKCSRCIDRLNHFSIAKVSLPAGIENQVEISYGLSFSTSPSKPLYLIDDELAYVVLERIDGDKAILDVAISKSQDMKNIEVCYVVIVLSKDSDENAEEIPILTLNMILSGKGEKLHGEHKLHNFREFSKNLSGQFKLLCNPIIPSALTEDMAEGLRNALQNASDDVRQKWIADFENQPKTRWYHRLKALLISEPIQC